MKTHKTMFSYVAAFCNRHLGKSFDEIVLVEELIDAGFLVRNADGSPYRHSWNGYKSLLKRNGYVNYKMGSPIIHCIRKITPSVTVSGLERSARKSVSK